MMIVIRATAMGIGAHVVAMIMSSSTVQFEGVSYPDETALTSVLVYVMCGCALQMVLALLLKAQRDSTIKPV